ncbi:MAG: hypothetical protein CW742_08930 [Methanoregula sp.]|nr:MAG: hypothetical protein CW742_08930 [Methanoregula sp.]
MAREDNTTNPTHRVPWRCTLPPHSSSPLLRENGCMGSFAHTCRFDPGIRGCAMRREPFFWIISAWWVVFLLCLVGVFGGSAAG